MHHALCTQAAQNPHCWRIIWAQLVCWTWSSLSRKLGGRIFVTRMVDGAQILGMQSDNRHNPASPSLLPACNTCYVHFTPLLFWNLIQSVLGREWIGHFGQAMPTPRTTKRDCNGNDNNTKPTNRIACFVLAQVDAVNNGFSICIALHRTDNRN